MYSASTECVRTFLCSRKRFVHNKNTASVYTKRSSHERVYVLAFKKLYAYGKGSAHSRTHSKLLKWIAVVSAPCLNGEGSTGAEAREMYFVCYCMRRSKINPQCLSFLGTWETWRKGRFTNSLFSHTSGSAPPKCWWGSFQMNHKWRSIRARGFEAFPICRVAAEASDWK